jgi:hypothetical protein
MTEQTELKASFWKKNKKDLILYTIIGALCAHSGFLNYKLNNKCDIHPVATTILEVCDLKKKLENFHLMSTGFFNLFNNMFSMSAEAYRKSSLGNQDCLNEIDDFVKVYNRNFLETFMFFVGKNEASEAEKALVREKCIEFTFETYDNGRIKRKEAINKDKS